MTIDSSMTMTIDTNFQTPPWCCAVMVGLLPSSARRVLEPTPGLGNLVRELEARHIEVIAPKDFDTFSPQGEKFDAVVMNPPFTPMLRGYEMLYRVMGLTNNIVALLPWLALINSAKRTTSIVEFGLVSVTHLPRNTFPGSRVQCCILQMCRGYHGPTELKWAVPGSLKWDALEED